MKAFVLGALLASSLAGCLSTEGPPLAGGPSWEVLDAPGADIEIHEDGATATWHGEIDPGAGRIVPDLRWLPPSAILEYDAYELTLPEATTLIEGSLAWDAGPGFLGFVLFDDQRVPQCGALFDNDLDVRCLAAHPPIDGPATWTIQVFGSPRAAPAGQSIGYTLALDLSAPDLPRFGPPMDMDAPRIGFEQPVLLPGHGDEPSIAVTEAGTVYVAARTFAPEGLWRSDGQGGYDPVQTGAPAICSTLDAGARTGWRSAGTVSHTGCGDVDVATAGEDTIYYYWHWGAEGTSVSHDGGSSWTHSVFATGPDVPHTDRAWLTLEDAQTAWLSWRDPAGTNTLGAALSLTIDGGSTWHKTALWPEILDECDPPIVLKSPDGMRYAPTCHDAGLALYVSADGGLTWTFRPILREHEHITDRHQPRLIGTVDGAGHIHLVWVEWEDDRMGTKVWTASSRDQGNTWSEPRTVSPGPGTYLMAWITSGDEDHVAITFYGTRAVDVPDYVVGDWYPIVVATDRAGEGDAVWHQGVATTDPSHYGPVCTNGKRCIHATQLGDLYQVTAGPEGILHVAYTDGTGGPADIFRELRVSGRVGVAVQGSGLTLGARAMDRFS